MELKPTCRHIMPGGRRCHAYALRDEPLCYFHNRLHRAAKQPVTLIDSIEIPLLEDRCAVQVVITRVLRALVKKELDRQTASTLLYGLQLALQSVDRRSWAVGFDSVEAFSCTPDGDEIAVEPADEYDEDDPDEEDGEYEDDEEGEDDSDSDAGDEDSGESEGEDGSDDGEQDEDSANDDDSTQRLIAQHEYIESAHRAIANGDMRVVAALIRAGG